MSIVLLILKILGIILLSFLGLIILAILMFLFCPLHYKIEADYKNEIYAKASFHWLLHFVRGFAQYKDNKPEFSFSILFWKLYPKKEKVKKTSHKKKKKTQKTKSSTKPDTSKKEEIAVQTKVENTSTDLVEDISDNVDIKTKDLEIKEEAKPEHTVDTEIQQEPDRQSLFSQLKEKIKKVLEFLVHIKYSLSKICDKIIDVINNIEFYIDLLNDANTKIVLNKVKKLFIRTFRRLKPKKFRAFLHLGFKDDPELEGKLLMVHGLLYPFHQGKLILQPDFETDEKEANLYAKGSITGYTFIKFVLLYYFDKNVKELKEILAEKQES